MDIRISIATRQPMSGVALLEGGVPHRFEGWLDLLGVLSDLIADPGEAPTGGDSASGKAREIGEEGVS